ncbi:MAG: hypothetical protein QXK41_05475 [Desulfurococcaceae archaeon]
MYRDHTKLTLSASVAKVTIDKIFRISKEGKILSAFCDFIDVFPENLKPYLEKRCELTKLYLKYLKIISEELKHREVEHYIFKTLRPFPYDLTDIDILLIDKKAFLNATKALIKNLGFKVISKGTHSLALRKNINGFDIDVDLQPSVYAGTFEYFPVLEKRKVIDIGHIKEEMPLLKPELELAIIAGHAVLKDFAISLADVLYLDHLIKISKDDFLSFVINDYPYLIKSIEIMRDIVNIFKSVIINCSNSNPTVFRNTLLLKSLLHQFNSGKGFFIIPLIIPIEIYLETFFTLTKKHDYKRLLGLALLPKSKGIKILFKRFNLVSEMND